MNRKMILLLSLDRCPSEGGVFLGHPLGMGLGGDWEGVVKLAEVT